MLLRPHRSVTHVRLTLGLMSLLLGSVGSARAQAPPSQGNQKCDTTTTAALLKRLGEAVDGYRTGQPVWVVATTAAVPNVVGVFANYEVARRTIETAGICARVFGPYVAPTDGAAPMMMLAAGTHHWPDSKYDSLYSSAVVPVSEVASVTVITRLNDGREIRTVYPGGEIDALFFTMPAIDKFAMCYYERLYGAGFAAGLRDRYLRMFGR